MSEVGTQEKPLRVAIVGAGPTGFYTAEHLFKRKDVVVEVDMFDSLPTPFGLVRAGVAPDHVHGDAGLVGRTGPGGDHDLLRGQRLDVRHGRGGSIGVAPIAEADVGTEAGEAQRDGAADPDVNRVAWFWSLGL